jgi:hypothetical protein
MTTSAESLDEALVRAVMVANARYACDGAAGRNQRDPVFEEVVEGRQKWRGYSSCGDLVHWCLRRAGFRDERVLNREDDDGSIPWRVSVNVSRLVYSSGHAFEWWSRGSPLGLRPGDMALIGENGQEHVFIVEEVTPDSVVSYDYGQFFNGAHGGKRVTRRLHTGPGSRLHLYGSTLPGRPFIGRLNPYELLEGPFLRNELEAAEVPDDFDPAVDAVASIRAARSGHDTRDSGGPRRARIQSRADRQHLRPAHTRGGEGVPGCRRSSRRWTRRQNDASENA